MRFLRSLIATAGLALVCALAVAAQADDTPELNVVGTFPDNPFSLVKNGQLNRIVLSITKPPGADRVLTLEGITGAYLDKNKLEGQKGHIVRNITKTPYKSVPLRSVGGRPVQIPYDFHAEFKPQEMGIEIRLLVNDGQTGKQHNLLGYRGTVTVVEPEKSIFDIQLLSLYAIFLSLVAGAGYWAYTTYVVKPSKKAPRGPITSDAPRSPAPRRTASGVNGQSTGSGYEEEWIPEHHLRSRKTRSSGALSSGDESPSPSSPAANTRGKRAGRR